MKTQSLQLGDIVTTAGTQIRAKVDAESVSDYAEAMTEGARFPPIVVFHDGSEYILADGFHRVMAAARNGFKDILAEVHKGTKSDALKFALGANTAHGIKRTNADKRRSVELALAEWPKLSDRQIAEICAVNHHLVSDCRKAQLGESPSSETRLGRDGKERRMPERERILVAEPQPAISPATARSVVKQFEVEEEKESQPAHKLSEFEEALIDDLRAAHGDLQELIDEIRCGDTDPQAVAEARANLSILSRKLGQYEKSISMEATP